MDAPLQDIKIVDLSSTLVGAQVAQFFADFGAEVVKVEPPGGSPLREEAGWPVWARGAKSIVLDLHAPDDMRTARDLCTGADVVVDTFRPGTAERLGLGYERLASENGRIICTSVTGFGRDGPLAGRKGYEGVVLAKMGVLGSGVFPVVPGASFSASQLAIMGTLVALYEREGSGRGQLVETSLVQGLTAHDTWNWMSRLVARRHQAASADAHPAPPPAAASRVPMSWVGFGLMIALTRDGRWLQFAHATTKGLNAFLRALGLGWTLEDPKWKDGPYSTDLAVREQFWELMLEGVRAKTTAEWDGAFDADTDVFAEVFRHDTELLHHPQMLHDRQVIEVDDPQRGRVRQPGPMVRLERSPGSGDRLAPLVNADEAELRGRPSPVPGPAPGPDAPSDIGKLPLAGVLVVEFATFYAAPFGTALLSDLGARVVKLEQLDGDPIRFQVSTPDVGGVKVTQGKQSIAVDITSPEGRQIALDLVRRADVVLRSFRGGVAERLGFDDESLTKLNPDLVYLNAPGFGVTGPYAHRPAFAPVIGAGSGFARRNGGIEVPEGTSLSLDDVKQWAGAGGAGVAHADGFAALGVGSALALGLLARARGRGGQSMLTTMLHTMAHVLSEDMVDYEGRPPAPTLKPDRRGFHALYRIYDTSRGQLFLAAPHQDEWEALAGAVGPELAADARFATVASRLVHDDELTAALEVLFAGRPADEWEQALTALDVGGAECVPGPYFAVMMDEGGLGDQLDMVTDVVHPTFGSHNRMRPLVKFSRVRRSGVARMHHRAAHRRHPPRARLSRHRHHRPPRSGCGRRSRSDRCRRCRAVRAVTLRRCVGFRARIGLAEHQWSWWIS